MHRSVPAAAVVVIGLLTAIVPAPAVATPAAPPAPGPHAATETGSQAATETGSQAAAAAANTDPASVLAAVATLRPQAAGTGEWVPAPPTQPRTYAAGERCDFPMRFEATVDLVVGMVLAKRPDGSTSREAFVGALVLRVTNTANGRTVDVDASGSGLVDYFSDGSMIWYAFGPVAAGFAAGSGNLPRGFYQINGLYRIVFTPSLFKTVTMVFGTIDDVCAHLA